MENMVEIIKGGAGYLAFVRNMYAPDGHNMGAAEQLDEFGPCQAIAHAMTKKALVAAMVAAGYAIAK